MDQLITHAAVRLYPGRRMVDSWRAVNLNSCISYKCSRLATMLLVAFMDGGDPDGLSTEFAKKYSFSLERVREAVTKLTNLGLLVKPDEPSHQKIQNICLQWSKYGWVDTVDYHIAAYNYPFADYAVDGRKIDFDRMREYASENADTNRFKTCQGVRRKVAAPCTADVLDQLNESFAKTWFNVPDLELLNKEKCLNLVSAAFGKLRTRKLSDAPNIIADAIGKTSPSGGSRHPTECYLFAVSVQGLESGIYHFNVEDSSLDMLKDFSGDKDELFRLFSGPLRASFHIDAFIVMTSVFERSMYRYREPRSFRAIYMDVGHICGTLDVIAKGMGLNCLVQHGVSGHPISTLLGIDPLFEGVIYGAAIGGRRNRDRSALVSQGIT